MGSPQPNLDTVHQNHFSRHHRRGNSPENRTLDVKGKEREKDPRLLMRTEIAAGGIEPGTVSSHGVLPLVAPCCHGTIVGLCLPTQVDSNLQQGAICLALSNNDS